MLKGTFSGLQRCCYLHSFSYCCLPNLRNPTKLPQNSNLPRIAVHGHPRSSILVPTENFLLVITNMHHPSCGISSLLHSVNLILFTLLLVHLILRISPSLSPSITHSTFHSRLKTHLFHISFPP